MSAPDTARRATLRHLIGGRRWFDEHQVRPGVRVRLSTSQNSNLHGEEIGSTNKHEPRVSVGATEAAKFSQYRGG